MGEEHTGRVAQIARARTKRWLTALDVMIAFPGAVYVVPVYAL